MLAPTRAEDAGTVHRERASNGGVPGLCPPAVGHEPLPIGLDESTDVLIPSKEPTPSTPPPHHQVIQCQVDHVHPGVSADYKKTGLTITMTLYSEALPHSPYQSRFGLLHCSSPRGSQKEHVNWNSWSPMRAGGRAPLRQPRWKNVLHLPHSSGSRFSPSSAARPQYPHSGVTTDLSSPTGTHSDIANQNLFVRMVTSPAFV